MRPIRFVDQLRPWWYRKLVSRARMAPEMRSQGCLPHGVRGRWFQEVLEALAGEDVEFFIGGSVAAAIVGARCVPKDVDIFFRAGADNAQRVARALGAARDSDADFPSWRERLLRRSREELPWLAGAALSAKIDLVAEGVGNYHGSQLATRSGWRVDVNAVRAEVFEQLLNGAVVEVSLWGRSFHVLSCEAQIAWLTDRLLYLEITDILNGASGEHARRMKRWERAFTSVRDLHFLRALYQQNSCHHSLGRDGREADVGRFCNLSETRGFAVPRHEPVALRWQARLWKWMR